MSIIILSINSQITLTREKVPKHRHQQLADMIAKRPKVIISCIKVTRVVFTESLEPLRCIQTHWTQESESQFYSMTITFPPLSPSANQRPGQRTLTNERPGNCPSYTVIPPPLTA